MARFFVSDNSISGNMAVITGSDVKHISRVLRLKPGAAVSLAVGAGREFTARIKEITNKEVVCEITGEQRVSAEAPVKVVLYQGLPKGEKMELIVQKSTELGVAMIVPVICERTVVKLDEKKGSERRQRWQKIAEEAAKQSRRTTIPEVTGPMPFGKALDRAVEPGVLGIMPWEEEAALGIKQVLTEYAEGSREGCREVAVFIGPEGGFSPEEAMLARERGISLVSLGPRILRTETAGIAAAAVILYELGDLGGTDNGQKSCHLYSRV